MGHVSQHCKLWCLLRATVCDIAKRGLHQSVRFCVENSIAKYGFSICATLCNGSKYGELHRIAMYMTTAELASTQTRATSRLGLFLHGNKAGASFFFNFVCRSTSSKTTENLTSYSALISNCVSMGVCHVLRQLKLWFLRYGL